MAKQTVVLTILDGWGIGENNNSNPIYIAKPENINYIKYHYPAGSLQASGIAVGLPWNEEGNSEVGHLTLGAGKIIYQHFPRINLAIKDGSFFKNEALLEAFRHAKENHSSVNLVGLLSEGNVHSSLEHLIALLQLADNEMVPKINLHLFTDGRDGPPQAAITLIKKIPQDKIASLSGRYFAMDRDLHWDRTGRVYKTVTNSIISNSQTQNAVELLESSYRSGLTDDFIEPTLLQPDGAIKDNDSVIFFNFREDSIRQLAEMFINPAAGESHPIAKNLQLVTFTEYSSRFKVAIAFPGEEIKNPLGKILADNNKVQLRIAETEKYTHVTYFFNGLREEAFKNEYRVAIPSRNVARVDEFPEMMAKEITTRAVSALNEGVYDFILINYANPDAIAHTGNFDAVVRALRVVDREIGILMKAVLENDSILIITSDHGNAERLIDPRTGLTETKHDLSQVPIYLVRKGSETTKDEAAVRVIERTNTGFLADVAPSILELMGIKKSSEMTGVSLLQMLK